MMNQYKSVSVPGNVSGLMSAAVAECYNQARDTGDNAWIQLAQAIREHVQAATDLGGLPLPPKPRGRRPASNGQ